MKNILVNVMVLRKIHQINVIFQELMVKLLHSYQLFYIKLKPLMLMMLLLLNIKASIT